MANPRTPLTERVERAAGTSRIILKAIGWAAESSYLADDMLDISLALDMLTDDLADLHQDVFAYEFPRRCAERDAKEEAETKKATNTEAAQ